MRKIIYHIAVTLDNYIARKDGSVDGFAMEGDHATEFFASLQEYGTVLMGRKTYEFGFQFGLKPGQPAYPHLQHYVFSSSMQFEPTERVVLVKENELEVVRQLKQEEGKSIWLCGGGEFAGFLLEHELIDEVVVKINPLVLGDGKPLFGTSTKQVALECIGSKQYNNGVLLVSYKICYS